MTLQTEPRQTQDRLRVLHISSGNLYGGVETTLATLATARELEPLYDPHFVLCFDAKNAQGLRGLGVPVSIVGPVSARRPWTVLGARYKLKKLLREAAPDIAICHMPWSLAVFGPALSQSGVPLVFWMHDRADGKHWVEKWASLQKPRFAICNSRYTAASLPALFPALAEGARIVHPLVVDAAEPLTAEQRATVRADFDTPAGSVVIAQVSRMEPYKGHLLHFDALALLEPSTNWICWVIGGAQRSKEQEYERSLRERARVLGIADRIRFLGQRGDVGRLLGATDLFCQPNIRGEPFGAVFIEALYRGIPVVSTNIGGAIEIVDETCGRLVPPDDPARLASALSVLIADCGLRAALGRAGPSRAKQLSSPSVNLPRLLRILRAAVAANSTT